MSPVAANQGGYVVYLVVSVLAILSFYMTTIIAAAYHRDRLVAGEICRLRAFVAARSGMEFAKRYRLSAIAPGEMLDTVIQVDRAEAHVTLRRVGPWLRVQSQGVWHHDTVTSTGLLGAAPPAFAANALSVSQSGAGIVVADRARLLGTVGTLGGGVTTRGSGVFVGRRVALEVPEDETAALDQCMDYVYRSFEERSRSGYRRDSLRAVEPGRLAEALAQESGPVHVHGNLILSEGIDMAWRSVWIGGNLILRDTAWLDNIDLAVRGDVFVTDEARLGLGSVVSLGDVRFLRASRSRAAVMCSETLSVTDEAHLTYPTVLYLSPHRPWGKGVGNQAMLLGGKARVEGTVLTGGFSLSSATPALSVVERASVEGIVYAPAAVTLYGGIVGSLYAGKLTYRRDRSVYDGWLMECYVKSRTGGGAVVPAVVGRGVPRYLNVREARS